MLCDALTGLAINFASRGQQRATILEVFCVCPQVFCFPGPYSCFGTLFLLSEMTLNISRTSAFEHFPESYNLRKNWDES